jgi:hypothetical protein
MNDQPAAGQNPYRARSLRHQLLARLLEIVLTPMDIAVESEVPVMSEPPRADVLLLRRRGKAWTAAQRDLLPDGVRDRNAQHHLLECKFSESLNAAAVQQALSYDYFYRQTHQLKTGELQTYVVSARTPRPAWLQQFGYSAEQTGVYVSTQPLAAKVVVLVLNELSDAPHNEFLRLFASRQQVRKRSIDEVLQHPMGMWPERFWAIVFGLQRFYQLEDATMKQEFTADDVIKIGAELRRQAIASATPEERLAGLAPEDRLAGLAPEDRLAGLAPEDRLAGLAPEEMAILLKQIEALLATQGNDRPGHRPHREPPA